MEINYKILTQIAALFALIVIAVVVVPIGIVNIEPSEVAVEINKLAGNVSEIPKGVGYHFYNRWTTDMIVYKVGSRSYPSNTLGNENSKEYTLDLKTNDGQNISADLTIIYSLNVNDVPKLHAQIGPNYEDQILLPQIRSEARIAIGGYSAEEIYQGKVREKIQDQIKSKLTGVLAKYPAIQIQDALIRHFSFSRDFEQAIEQKKLAAQQVEINKNRALAQEEESKRQEAEARGYKLKAIQDASGRAESAKIEADAQRYKLEQEAAGNLAIYKADAEGKKLQAEALGGGQNVVALKFAENIPDKLQIWGIPTGQNNTSLMDVSGIFGKMFEAKKDNMEPFKTHTGIAAPLDRVNIDTDAIIPKQFLKKIDKKGFGKHLFHELRFLDYEGTQENPDFILNQDTYRKSSVLLTRDNFGCGSSREHAPWALEDYGFRVIIAPSFADIFFNNCVKNGILLVQLKTKDVDELFQYINKNKGATISADLAAQTVTANGKKYSFEIDAFNKECLLNGLDSIGWTMQFKDKIASFEENSLSKRPWLTRK